MRDVDLVSADSCDVDSVELIDRSSRQSWQIDFRKRMHQLVVGLGGTVWRCSGVGVSISPRFFVLCVPLFFLLSVRLSLSFLCASFTSSTVVIQVTRV